MNNKYDNILKELLKNKKDSVSSGQCLPEEIFAAYLDNLLDGAEKEKVEGHLSQCKVCRQQHIVLSRVRNEAKEDALLKAPWAFTGKAKQLVHQPQAKDWVEVVLKFAKDSMQVIKDSASVIQPLELAPAGLRSDRVKGDKTVCMKKEFNGILVSIAIEDVNNARCDIDVQITELSTGDILNGIRLNLVSEGKELASFLTVNGRSSFNNIMYKTYSLIIMKGDNIIGEIFLKLEHE